jgi:peroxiredoxin Q/BCP
MVEVGKKAPDFTLLNQDGKKVKLSEFVGKNIVLYFYPKDNTPGCTQEACNFRDIFPNLNKLNTVVIGISPDSVESHKKFAEKFNLPFNLLSDTNHNVLKKYGVWKEKNMCGKKYMGVERTTFIINKDRIVKKIIQKVKVPNHHNEVLMDLEEI